MIVHSLGNYAFWALYLLCMLLPLALLPFVAPNLWFKHRGKLSLIWMLAFNVFCLTMFRDDYPIVVYRPDGPGSFIPPGINPVTLSHFFMVKYILAVTIIFALLAIGAGFSLTGRRAGTPKLNLTLLTIGVVLSACIHAIWVILLVPLLLQSNAQRRFRAHSVIFLLLSAVSISSYLVQFLFPLDLPPELAFLKSPFPWGEVLRSCAVPAAMLAVYFLVDLWLFKKENHPDPEGSNSLSFHGWGNLLLLPLLVGMLWLPFLWESGIVFDAYNYVQVDLSAFISFALLITLIIATGHINRRRAASLSGKSAI